jgi:N-acetylglucosaminyldiphosphoundecaprenol N-acetyl-beta-D-mannosaminyltransferase
MGAPTLAAGRQQFAKEQALTLRGAKRAHRVVQSAQQAFARIDVSRLAGIVVAIPLVVVFGLFWGFMLFPACGRRRRIGLHGHVFCEYHWKNLAGLRGKIVRRMRLTSLPRAWNLLRGDLAVIGPRLEEWSDSPSSERRLRRCRDAAPGLLSLFRLRRMTNIDFDDELTTEVRYVESRSWKSDLGLLARLLLTSVYGGGSAATSRFIHHLGIRIDNLRMQEACTWIAEQALVRTSQSQVTFVNAHCMNVSCTDAEYRRVVQGSALVLADGIGMKLAGRLLHQPVAQNVNGTDLFPMLCNMMRAQGSRIYLLGGQPGVAEKVESWVEKQYPGCKIAGTHHGFIASQDEPMVAEEIRRTGADVLLVAMGVPGQEKWIARNLERSGVAVAIGVGGLFDFYSDRIPRAPVWMRELGLEWVYRLGCEPRRMWRRYIVGNLLFLARVMQERRTGSAHSVTEAK